jgi:GntR family transcriptional regulator, transcriptional repressor for pyruvate dehydrogenase complex
MKFERVQQIRLHEQIIARFNAMADAGELSAGDRLPPERELLVQLGVSRQVLREALTVMEAQGMLTTTPGGGRVFDGRAPGDVGAFLEALKASALFEILDAREAIESKTAELAAVHASAEDIDDLRQRVASLEVGRYSFEWNYDFHLAIAEVSGNQVLHHLLQLLLQARREVQQHDYLTQEQLTRLFAEHAALIDAIATHDPVSARKAMTDHFATTRSAFQQRREERQQQQRPAPRTKTGSAGRGRTQRGSGAPK